MGLIMSKYLPYKNAFISNYSNELQDAREVFLEQTEMILDIAWNFIEGNEHLLKLYPHLRVYEDKNGNPVRILPIPDWKVSSFGIEISEEQNFCLAILENCLYLHQGKDQDNDYNTLNYDNKICLALGCGQLFEVLNELVDIEYKKNSHLLSVWKNKNYSKYIQLEDDQAGKNKWLKDRLRTNQLIIEIDEIIEKILAEGKTVKTQYVWKELVARCGKDNSCCASLMTKDNKAVIEWFGIQGNRKHLDHKALQGILDRTREKKPR